MSLYNELQQRGYRRRIWTVLYPESLSEREFYGDRLAKIIADKYDENPMQVSLQTLDASMKKKFTSVDCLMVKQASHFSLCLTLT